jgi:hypothetical protein
LWRKWESERLPLRSATPPGQASRAGGMVKEIGALQARKEGLYSQIPLAARRMPSGQGVCGLADAYVAQG